MPARCDVKPGTDPTANRIPPGGYPVPRGGASRDAAEPVCLAVACVCASVYNTACGSLESRSYTAGEQAVVEGPYAEVSCANAPVMKRSCWSVRCALRYPPISDVGRGGFQVLGRIVALLRMAFPWFLMETVCRACNDEPSRIKRYARDSPRLRCTGTLGSRFLLDQFCGIRRGSL